MPNEYDEYFGSMAEPEPETLEQPTAEPPAVEEPPTPRRRRPPEVTGTSGQEIRRVCAATLERVLNDPHNVTAHGSHDHALVACVELDLYIRREGRHTVSAQYRLAVGETVQVFDGAEGRDTAIALFLKFFKERR